MILFWILWGIDALVGLIFLFFFVVGLSDGSVSAANIGIWVLILSVVIIGFLFGSFYLNSNKHEVMAKILLSFLAIPSLLFVLFYVVLFLSGASWH